MLERERKKKQPENGKRNRTIEAEVNSKSLVNRRHISHLRRQAVGERISNTAGGCFTLWEACSLLDFQNHLALNIHFIFNINQWGEMRHADRSCLSDIFYQNLKLGAWQQSCHKVPAG